MDANYSIRGEKKNKIFIDLFQRIIREKETHANQVNSCAQFTKKLKHLR